MSLTLKNSHRVAIQTRFYTTANGAGKIKAWAYDREPVRVNYEYGGTFEEHARAARAFLDKMGWEGTLYGGGSADGRGEVFVFVPEGSE